jgi:hypothetical protein
MPVLLCSRRRTVQIVFDEVTERRTVLAVVYQEGFAQICHTLQQHRAVELQSRVQQQLLLLASHLQACLQQLMRLLAS